MKDVFNKLVRSKFSIIYLLLTIALLYTLQEKAIMPLVLSVVKSEAFFEKPVEENEPLGKLDTKTERTAFALANCRDAVRKEAHLPDDAQFQGENYEAWALGNRQYLIRSSVKVSEQGQATVDKLFACTIRLTADDQSKPENWTILGVDFNAEGT
jgi:hypothetical protein